jgi:hypothetical protein
LGDVVPRDTACHVPSSFALIEAISSSALSRRSSVLGVAVAAGFAVLEEQLPMFIMSTSSTVDHMLFL